MRPDFTEPPALVRYGADRVLLADTASRLWLAAAVDVDNALVRVHDLALGSPHDALGDQHVIVTVTSRTAGFHPGTLQ